MRCLQKTKPKIEHAMSVVLEILPTFGAPLVLRQSSAAQIVTPIRPAMPLSRAPQARAIVPNTARQSSRRRNVSPSPAFQQKQGAVAVASPMARQQPLIGQELAAMPVTFRGGETGQARRILCYGDSLTAGFCSGGHQFEPYGRAMSEALAASGVTCEVSICGHSGGTAQEMISKSEGSLVDVVGCQGKGLANILKEDKAYDLVIIMAGTNDMARRRQRAAILEDVRSLHAICHAKDIPTVALIPPPAPGSMGQREVERQRIGTLLQNLCRITPGIVACVDTADLVPATSIGCWESDGLHYSPLGSRTLGQRLAALAGEHLTTPIPRAATGLPTLLGRSPLFQVKTGLKAAPVTRAKSWRMRSTAASPSGPPQMLGVQRLLPAVGVVH